MSALAESAVEEVAALVAQRTGIVVPAGRREALVAAVEHAFARTGAGSARQLEALLAVTPPALEELVGELTVHESYFFRGPEQFVFLRREVLPEIAGRREFLRVLSAGCANGEEAYSLAIALAEAGLLRRATVIGADISRASLARAREGTYGEWSLRGTDEAARSRWLTRKGGRYTVREEVREAVDWAFLNLAEGASSGLGGFDLIFCRNALIYLRAEAAASAGRWLLSALAPGGWLVCGASDPALSGFEAVDAGLAGPVYRRPAGALTTESQAQYVLDTRLPEEKRAEVAPAPDARALADGGDLQQALAAAEAAARAHATDPEAHYLFGILLLEVNRDRDAADALRRALFLDRTLALPAFALGLALRRLGESAAAARALRHARELLKALPAEQLVPLADGDRAGALLTAVELQLQLLERDEQ